MFFQLQNRIILLATVTSITKLKEKSNTGLQKWDTNWKEIHAQKNHLVTWGKKWFFKNI